MAERIVTIFGSGRGTESDNTYELAEQIGRQLAEAGFTIANGGYGGTMLASAKGAAKAGGKTIGVTCSAFGPGKVNQYISREIVTASLDERLETLVRLGRAYVVLPGGTGTLLELAKVGGIQYRVLRLQVGHLRLGLFPAKFRQVLPRHPP